MFEGQFWDFITFDFGGIGWRALCHWKDQSLNYNFLFWIASFEASKKELWLNSFWWSDSTKSREFEEFYLLLALALIFSCNLLLSIISLVFPMLGGLFQGLALYLVLLLCKQLSLWFLLNELNSFECYPNSVSLWWISIEWWVSLWFCILGYLRGWCFCIPFD